MQFTDDCKIYQKLIFVIVITAFIGLFSASFNSCLKTLPTTDGLFGQGGEQKKKSLRINEILNGCTVKITER